MTNGFQVRPLSLYILFMIVACFRAVPAQIVYDPLPGFHSSPVNLVLEPEVELADAIRYTLNGSPVTEESSLYDGPLELTGPTVIRARLVNEFGSLVGDETFASYIVGIESSLPIFSVIVDPFDLWDDDTGILANPMERGREWERPAHMTYISEDRQDVISIPCGIRVHGGWGSSEKQSLRLYFRSDYGESKFRCKVFPNSTVDRWDRVLLRSGSQDSQYSWTMLRNQPLYDFARDMGHYAPAGDFSLIFLNGEGWGVYNHMEYLDDRFMRDNMGVINGEGDMLRTHWYIETREGSAAGLEEFIGFYTETSPESTESFAEYERRMDIANYTFYQILQITAGNQDWPQNNVDMVRAHREDARWKWVIYDLDWAQGMFAGPDDPVLEWALRDELRPDLRHADYEQQLWTTLLTRRLLENEEYRGYFIQSFAHHLSTTFAPENIIPRFEAARDRIEADIPHENEAWTGVLPDRTMAAWHNHVDILLNFWEQRPAIQLEQIRDYFDLPQPVEVTVLAPPEGKGWVSIEGTRIEPEESWTGLYFPGFPLRIAAIPAREHRFTAWVGDDKLSGFTASFTKTVEEPMILQPTFEEVPIEVAPYDVIFNEYWIEDNRTPYDSIEGRSIEDGWIELFVANPNGVDLRGWRITNNATITKQDPEDLEEGSMIFPDIAELAHVPFATVILVVPTIHMHNTENFPHDELDSSTGRMIFYTGNGNLDIETDPGFSMRRQDDAFVLLHPGKTDSFEDDIGVNFIAEGERVTPASFGVASHHVFFINPFEGIGSNDGAIFTNDPDGGFNNFDGADPDRTDDQPGPGGWIVDPPNFYTGGDPEGTNILTPGAINYMQQLLPPAEHDTWKIY